MSNVGFIILAHHNLSRTRQLVTYLADQGCPVALHVDKTSSPDSFRKYIAPLAEEENIYLTERGNCEWGTFSIVAATLRSAELLLKKRPDLQHVFLSSGSCLPNKPVRQLQAFLAEHPQSDFIKCLPINSQNFIKDGLETERLSLYFPLPWRAKRKWFDRLVRFQRYFRVRRSLPKGLLPHVGPQWWCLTSATLLKILNDPRRKTFDNFFRWTWIPDESYFQTMCFRHSENMVSHPLTFVQFDHEGKPFNFYDDHLPILKKIDSFMIRKVWPGASRLYRELLKKDRDFCGEKDEDPLAVIKMFEASNLKRSVGRKGIMNHGSFPAPNIRFSRMTPGKYSVFFGFSDLFEEFPTWLSHATGTTCHGKLFSRTGVEFANDAMVLAGNVPADIKIRDRNVTAFLSNVVRAGQPDHVSFLFELNDKQVIRKAILKDPNACLFLLQGAWIMQLAERQGHPRGYLVEAQRLFRREQQLIQAVNRTSTLATVKIYDFETICQSPQQLISDVIADAAPEKARKLFDMPRMKAVDGVVEIAENLRKEGIAIGLASPPETPDNLRENTPRPSVVS